MKGLAMYRTILAPNVSYERLVLDWLQNEAQDELATQKGKGPGRGWWGPQKGGTHGAGSGGSGDSTGPKLTMDDQLAAKVKYQIKHFGIPEEHANGLQEITTDLPLGYKQSGEKWLNKRGHKINGAYNPATSRVYLNAKSGVGTLVHEIGHHVTRKVWWEKQDQKTFRNLEGMVGDFKRMPDRDLGLKFGLRRYSTTSVGEFLADAYKVRWAGNPRMWTALSTYATDSMIDLEGIVNG